MDDREFIFKEFIESARLLEQLASQLAEPLERLGKFLTEQLASGHKIMILGNGGSAADAQHFAAELVGRYRRNRTAIPAIALTTDTSLLTAVGNDFSFEDIFSRQIEALAQPGDVVFGISTSGRSKNVLSAFNAARLRKATTVALVGSDSSEVKALSDYVISVPSRDTARIQEAHAIIIHILSDLIEQAVIAAGEVSS
ncbi:MAG: SIS domain-containing protein [Omnitrophica WOR_2 bacterium]